MADAGGVGNAPRAACSAERCPVPAKESKEADTCDSPNDKTCWKSEDLGKAVAKVSGVHTRGEHHHWQADGQNTYHNRQRELEGVVGNVCEEETGVFRSFWASVERHRQSRDGCGGEDGPAAADEL